MSLTLLFFILFAIVHEAVQILTHLNLPCSIDAVVESVSMIVSSSAQVSSLLGYLVALGMICWLGL